MIIVMQQKILTQTQTLLGKIAGLSQVTDRSGQAVLPLSAEIAFVDKGARIDIESGSLVQRIGLADAIKGVVE